VLSRAQAEEAAYAAESSPVLRGMARAGYGATGLVHALIGTLVLVVAFGGSEEPDQTGAFKTVADAPLGVVLLGAVALALWALAAWRVLAGVIVRRSSGSAKDEARTAGRRAAEWGPAVAYAVLGVVALIVAFGARPDAERTTEDTTRGVLALPGGPLLVAAAGLGVLVAGAVFVVMGVRRSFLRRIEPPAGALGRGIEAVGVLGHVAKGVALVVVGVLLVTAAVRIDPGAAGGLDGATHALLALPLGGALAAVVGVGLIAYGVYCGFRARYARD